MVQSTGTQFFNKDGSLNLRTPAVKQSLAILKDLNDKGSSISPRAGTTGSPRSTTATPSVS